ncbi:2319_t:CDS:2, partial [Dentiscutata erythropus]
VANQFDQERTIENFYQQNELLESLLSGNKVISIMGLKQLNKFGSERKHHSILTNISLGKNVLKNHMNILDTLAIIAPLSQI